MGKLSALVCVQNQEAQLADCLRRLWFCDEIVVVADRCSDASVEIARRHGATVVAGIFPLESQRKAAGVAACTGDWILEIAPDERVESALAWEVRATLKLGLTGDHFEIPIHNYVGDALVAHGWTGLMGSEREVRLYRPWAKRWLGRRRDAGVGVGAAGGALKGALRRQAADSLGDMVESFNRSTSLRAEDLADAGHPGQLDKALREGLGGFFRSYLARRGWRENGLGLAIAAMAALHPVVSQLKAQEALESRRRIAAEPVRETARVVKLGVG